MKNKIIFSLALVLSLGTAACGDDDTGGTDGGVPDGGSGPPAAPTVGGMIDRMGRPGVNTAVTDPFNTTNAMQEDMNKDRFNAAEQSTWSSSFTTSNAANLAVYDGLDRACGNQVFAGNMASAGRYNTLAGALADDQLYVNTSKTNCTQYLAAELVVAGAMVFANDCGGRKPEYDVIDVTYSAFAAGLPSGVGDGIASDSTFSATFPWLAAPNP
jgi:hypothetical protein